MYTAKLVTIKESFSIPGKDRIIAVTLNEIEDTKVIISKDYNLSDKYVYFPKDVRLSLEFCEKNNLLIIKGVDGKKIGGGYFDENCRVRAQKFGGVRSEGIIVPLHFLDYLKDSHGRMLEALKKESPGHTFDRFGSYRICEKYLVKKHNYRASRFDIFLDKLDNSRFYKLVPFLRAVRKNIYLVKKSYQNFRESFNVYSYRKDFPRHADTEALKFHMRSIPAGTRIIVTEKLHGTSGQVGKIVDPSLKPRLKRLFTGKSEYKFQVGTRNVVLKEGGNCSFYKDPFRWNCAEKFKNIEDGELFSKEIVGYATNGRPFMTAQHLNSIKRDISIKGFKDPMIYSYGCEEGECDVYVYKYSKLVNGEMVVQSWEDTVRRCKELGIKTVPQLDDFIYDGSPDNLLKRLAPFMADEKLTTSTIDKRHITEGVVLRFVTDNNEFKVLKHKSFWFGVLEGYIKDSGIEDVN